MSIVIHRPAAFTALPSAVLFDLDDTLYAYRPAHAAGLHAARAKAARQFNIPENRFNDAFDAARLAVKERLGLTASAHSRLLYFQLALEGLGFGSRVLPALDLEQTYWRAYLASAQLFDGVVALLDDLRIAGIPAGVVTDLGAQIQFRKIVYFGLDNHIDFIVTSEEAGADKPAPAIFHLAAAKLKPRGDRLWMVGEDPARDIGGARAAIGAATIQKIHEGVTPGTGDLRADAEVTHFDALRRLIADLRARRDK